MYTRVSGTLDSIGITNIAGLQSMYRARRCFNLGPFSWISHIDCDGDDDGWFLQRFERDVAERDHTAIDWPIDGAQRHVRVSLSLSLSLTLSLLLWRVWSICNGLQLADMVHIE